MVQLFAEVIIVVCLSSTFKNSEALYHLRPVSFRVGVRCPGKDQQDYATYTIIKYNYRWDHIGCK